MKQRLAQQLLALEILFKGLDDEDLDGFLRALEPEAKGRLFVAGFGRSGRLVEAFAARLARGGRPVHGAFEATAPRLATGDVLLAASGSGLTRALDPAFDRARELGVPILLATANALSPLARRADQVLLLPPALPPGGSGVGEAILGPLRIVFEQALLLVLDAAASELLEGGSPSLGG